MEKGRFGSSGRTVIRSDGSKWTYTTVYYRGRRQEIPVDEHGHVPVIAMVQHYQAMGNSDADREEDSSIIYPIDASPKEIAQWWADPSSCDIEGIDTRKSKVYDVSGVKGKRMKEIQSRIGIITPSKRKAKSIRNMIASAFTEDELDNMTRDGSFIITTEKNCGDATGYYLRKQTGVEIPLIVVEESVTPDGLVHEVIHHARTKRTCGNVTKTAFPTRKDGSLDEDRYYSMSQYQRDEIHDAEESSTVAETLVRTKRDPAHSGYYDYAGGREGYLQDNRRLSHNRKDMDQLKGAAAIRRVESDYKDLNIAMAKILSDKPAKESVKSVNRQQAAVCMNKKKKTARKKR